MLTVDQLKAYGASIEEGLGRCMNNEGFYLKLVGMAVQDKNFDALTQALKANDLDRAFDAAHALKGALGNLALTPVYEPVCQVTELLRGRTATDYTPYLQQITQQRDKLLELVK